MAAKKRVKGKTQEFYLHAAMSRTLLFAHRHSLAAVSAGQLRRRCSAHPVCTWGLYLKTATRDKINSRSRKGSGGSTGPAKPWKRAKKTSESGRNSAGG